MSLRRLKLEAVIFDMDGVITNTMPDHFRAWKTIFNKEGIPVTHHDIYSREGQRGIHSVREIFAAYGRSFSAAKAKELLRRKERLFQRIVQRRFIPGARRLIRDLKSGGFRLALVTGTSRHELHRILPENLYELFDVVVTGSDVRHGKPHPEPFRKAVRELKISRRYAVVLENAPFGIRSAKAAGLHCLALSTSLPEAYLKQADGVFHSIRDLRSQLRFLHLRKTGRSA